MGKRRKRGAKGGAGGGIVRIAFRSYITTALSSNLLVLAMSPANIGSGSITAIYPGFELFRFKRLHVKMLVRQHLSTLACGYNADAVVGSPGSLQDVMALLDSAIIVGNTAGAGDAVPVGFSVKPVRLKGQVQWYKCTPDASDTSLEQQGSLIWYGSGATDSVTTVITGELEFKNPVDPTIASANLKQRLRSEIMAELASLSLQTRMPLPVSNTVGSCVFPYRDSTAGLSSQPK